MMMAVKMYTQNQNIVVVMPKFKQNTVRSGKTVHTKTRLLLEEHSASDQGLHFLLLH